MSIDQQVLANETKRALKRGERVVGSMSSVLGCPEAMRLFALAGLDYVIIDSEHSPYDIFTLRRLVEAGRLSGITPFIRVPDAEYHLIARALDTGALGVMVPRVETREVVEKVVGAVKYPPLGRRGCGAVDLQNDFLPISAAEHIARSNEETLVIIQVETRRALEAVEELVSVEGVDVALIGPLDFSIGLGIAGQFRAEIFVEAAMRVIRACEGVGVASGIHVPEVEALEFWAERGMRFLTCSSDFALMKKGIEELGGWLGGLKGSGK